MFSLGPDLNFDTNAPCPSCGRSLIASAWAIPGMRNLGLCHCDCGGSFYVDLPAGQGALTPIILDRKTGKIFDRSGAPWFGQWLSDGYRTRRDAPPPITEDIFRPIRQPLLLNCLDLLYGHELMKLMNAQHYLDHYPEHDLVVLIHKNFRWLVPDGVAAVWSLDAPMSKGTDWNDGLDTLIKARLRTAEAAWLAQPINLPHSDDFDIARFTRVLPFPRDDFDAWLEAPRRPRVVFVYREDRYWFGDGKLANAMGALAIRAKKRVPLVRITRRLQHRAIISLANSLRRNFAHLQFSVIGMGSPGGFPSWIEDHRTIRPSIEVESATCRTCANAHIVIGVHGSNMLLPAAHSAAVIDMMPDDRWHNLAQDLPLPLGEARAQALRVICLPVNTGPQRVALVADSILNYASHVLRLGRKYTRHDTETISKLASLAQEAVTAFNARNS